jgi:hypothetical protein
MTSDLAQGIGTSDGLSVNTAMKLQVSLKEGNFLTSRANLACQEGLNYLRLVACVKILQFYLTASENRCSFSK